MTCSRTPDQTQYILRPKYIYLHPTSGYIFRLCVPSGLREYVGQGEFRYSLRTGSIRRAAHRAQQIAAYIHKIFNDLRMKVATNMTQAIPDSTKIKAIVKQYVQETLVNDERIRSGMSPAVDLDVLTGANMGLSEVESMQNLVKRWLRYNDHSIVLKSPCMVENYLSQVDDDNDQKALARELLKAFQDVLSVREKRTQGDYSKQDHELLPLLDGDDSVQPQAHLSTENPKVDALTFRQVQELYITEVEAAESWTEKTKHENLAIFDLFVEVHGDVMLSDISRKLMAEHKSTLMKLPPNMKKNGAYRWKSVHEVLNMAPLPKTLSVNTINKHIRRLSGLFNYAVKNGHLEGYNPAEGLQIKQKKRKDEERSTYTTDELKILLPQEIVPVEEQGYRYWTPWLALYTGARLEELCQLHLEDIRKEEGVYCIDINDLGGKKLKTLSSRRLVPLHPRLINDLGLLSYVEHLRSKGEDRLFPELRHRRDGYGQTVSKWFARHREAWGIGGTNSGKTFHSFRHTFITALKHAGVDRIMVCELDGHTVEGEISRYGKRYPVKKLFDDGIMKLDFGV